jgi:tetratricopeptide (TPR) repeat protein
VPFKVEKPFRYDWIRAENTLVLQFPNTAPNELESFNHYDESLIRRLMVKDLGPAGTEVHLVLINRNIRALVTSFKDPFRVAIDLFDKDYKQKNDPVTGLPSIDSTSDTSKQSTVMQDSNTPKARDSLMANLNPSPSNASTDSETPTSNKRRLMQSLPDEINSPNQLKAALAQIAPGVGKGWNEYPPYVYRAQLAPYEGREAPENETSPFQTKAIKNSNAMADYASKLYDLGHEGRALIASSQVLLKDPRVFEKDPIHLWKFAECHLGQGNFQLADGYYSTLLDKHRSHPLANFAQLRRLDVQAIKGVQQSNSSMLVNLANQLRGFQSKSGAELYAQSLIREAWWTDPAASQKRDGTIPNASEEVQRSLVTTLPNVESQRTAFLGSSLVARRMTLKSTPWESSYATWLNEYFTKFKGPGTEPIRGSLSTAAKDRLSQEIKAVFANGNFMRVVSMFESLPEPMKSIRKLPDVAWAIAESYRLVGQNEKSVPHYQTATNVNQGIDRFKAEFWLMNTSGTVAQDLQAKNGSQDRIRDLRKTSFAADKALEDTWQKLKSDERAQIQSGMADPIEANVASELKSKTPAKVLLDKYSSALTMNPPKLSTNTGTNPTDPVGNFSPTAGTVRLLDDLGKKFAVLGLQPERRRALELMRFIKPSSIESDKAAQKIWTEQLTNLAEDHRKANEFLEAGELYSMIGDGGTEIENKAEANYKGGLLLYRAGKKQEAIKALEKAKSDPNNLFYSKLATERLDQLQAH